MLNISRFGRLFGCILLGACSEDVPPESVAPLRLAVDASVAAWSPLPDRSAESEMVTPWDNFQSSDSLNQTYKVSYGRPR